MKHIYQVEFEREEDGRWVAEVPTLPGVLVYGSSRDEAFSRVQALALRAIADEIEHGQLRDAPLEFAFAAA